MATVSTELAQSRNGTLPMNVPDKQSADGLGDQELYELAAAVNCRARAGTGTRQTGALWPVIDR